MTFPSRRNTKGMFSSEKEWDIPQIFLGLSCGKDTGTYQIAELGLMKAIEIQFLILQQFKMEENNYKTHTSREYRNTRETCSGQYCTWLANIY